MHLRGNAHLGMKLKGGRSDINPPRSGGPRSGDTARPLVAGGSISGQSVQVTVLAETALPPPEVTDEASAMEFAGYTVELIDSDPANIKITRPADLPLAQFYLQQSR